jgi:4-aminobutyrate aminotransferase-like enzyme/Ser/Thr protein kinase RdoA (MazF antagonist)
METATKFVGAHPPEFSLEEARRIAAEHFGVTGELTPLWGERDQNFAVSHDSHRGYVLKISNDREDPGAIDFQIQALEWLAQQVPALPVPRLRPSLRRRSTEQVTGRSGATHFVHMVTLLEGLPVSEVEINSDVFYAAGALAGDVAKGLRGFFHPTAGHKLFWDVRHIGEFAHYVEGLTDPGLRRAVRDFIPSFCAEIVPTLGRLRSQVIHHDANLANLLVDPADPARMTGLVDFGDMIHGPIPQDVAVAAVELQWGQTDILNGVAAVVSGYDSTFALEEAEIDILYDLMVARAALALLIGVTRDQNRVVSVADLNYASLYAPLLEALLTSGRDRTRAAIRAGCRFPVYCPATPLPAGTHRAATDDLIARRQAVLGKTLSLTYDTPLHAVRGEGVWLYDVDGRRHLDCYNNVPHVGHCHPHVVRAISRQAGALNTNTRYLFESVVEYAEALGALMPGDLGVCLFVNSGSEANDLALRMSKVCTGRDGALIMDGAYHGITSETYALSPSNDWGMGNSTNERHVSETRPDIQALMNPDTVRGPYRAGDRDAAEKYAADADRAIATLTGAGHPLAAFIVDSAFSTSGILDVPEGYLRGVEDRVRDAGGLVIADEVQSGFGRSGAFFWGFETHGINPDFVTLGKPIGNGLALGAVVTTREILERFARATDFFSTFGGNPVACAAGLAVLDVIEKENLLENARETGAYLIEGLRGVAKDSASIGDVRGRGLFVGVDIVSDKGSMTPDGTECARIKNRLRAAGILVGSEGIADNILKIRPPMVFRPAHADRLIAALREAAVR